LRTARVVGTLVMVCDSAASFAAQNEPDGDSRSAHSTCCGLAVLPSATGGSRREANAINPHGLPHRTLSSAALVTAARTSATTRTTAHSERRAGRSRVAWLCVLLRAVPPQKRHTQAHDSA
jgi:hypothetical protein